MHHLKAVLHDQKPPPGSDPGCSGHCPGWKSIAPAPACKFCPWPDLRRQSVHPSLSSAWTSGTETVCSHQPYGCQHEIISGIALFAMASLFSVIRSSTASENRTMEIHRPVHYISHILYGIFFPIRADNRSFISDAPFSRV